MKINYKLSGTPNSPVLVLSNSLGSTYRMWDELVPYLLPYFRVLQYDTRGHGGSEKPNHPYTMDQLGQDVINLLNELDIDKAYFCGVSMGGLTGQWLAVNSPDRFFKICISNTAAKIGDQKRWEDRVDTLQKNGMSVLTDSTMEKWFTSAFHEKHPDRLQAFHTMFNNNDINGYCNCCYAIGGADFRENLKNIALDILIITGDDDPVTNVEEAEYLKENISHARLVVLPGRHLVNAEIPELYADTLVDFFIGSSTYDRGMHVRETVLGIEHLSKIKENKNAFTDDFQDLIANVPWGKIWTRPGLTKHQRSLITLSMMIALDKPEEFKMHIKAAFNNGVTLEELKELILQSAVYCGFPAANKAYKIAEEVLKEKNINY